MPRLGIAALTIGALLVLSAVASAWLAGGAPLWGVWLMVVGSALLMSGMLALGAARSRISRGRVMTVALLLLAVIVGGFGAPLLLPPESAEGVLFLGLPLRAAIEIYGVGLLPACFLPFVFAIEFRADGLDDTALESVRRECERLREGA